MGSDSIKGQLLEILDAVEEKYDDEVTYCRGFIETVDSKQSEILKHESEPEYAELMELIQYVLLYISQTLRGIKSQKVAISALCDTLVLYAKTETYFTVADYHRVRGDEVQIRKCDVHMDNNQRTKASELAVNDQSKSAFKGCKEYDPSYIWGQLVGWYK